MLREKVAGATFVRHRPVLVRKVVADAVCGSEDDRNRRRILEHDSVRRRVADPVRVLQPELERIDPEHFGDPVHVRLHGKRDRGYAEAAHRRRRHAVREDHEAVEMNVRDRVRTRVVERMLRHAVRREAGIRASVVERRHPAAENPAVTGDGVGELHVPGRARRGGEELLFACPAPLHRPLGLEREQRRDRLARRVDLAAETTADRSADELQLVERPLRDARRRLPSRSTSPACTSRSSGARSPPARRARSAARSDNARSPAGGTRPPRSCPPARTPRRCRPCARARWLYGPKCGYTGPHWWIFGQSASIALRMSKNAGRSSYSISIRSTASRAVSSSTAATAAIGWPL